MLDKTSSMSIRHQSDLLGVSRGKLYYTPSVESKENLEIMQKLDAMYQKMPFLGLEKLLIILSSLGYKINRKRLRRLMKLVCWQTLYQKPKTTNADKTSYKYPYLLKDLKIEHPNQVWAIDITYLPLRNGFMYLFAIIDIYSRYIVAWSLSNDMSAEWCCDCIKDAIDTYGKPEIINSDQGCQFTSEKYVNLLKNNDIKISMDGKNRAIDNIFIERFWRTIKYDYVYSNPTEDVKTMFSGINEYIRFYNNERPHQSLNNSKPKEYYYNKCAA
jgi:putative transposase